MTKTYEQKIAPDIRLIFATAADAIAFLKEEEARWQNMAAVQTKFAPVRDRAVQHQSSRLKDMLSHVVSIAQSSNWSEQLSPLQWFSEKHTGGRILCSIIPADAAVLQLASTDPDAAVMGMSARQRATETMQHIVAGDRADAIMALHRFTAVAGGLPAQEQSYAVFAKITEDTLTRWRAEIEAANAKAAAALTDGEARAVAIQAAAEVQAAKHGEMLTEHQKTIKDLEHRFLTEMTLRGPVQYWKDRASDGRTAAWRWLGGFVVAAFVIFGVVIWAGPGLLSLLKDDKGQISLAGVPLLVAALIPLLWVLRHIARMFADSIADARDAAQRSALTSTFLAMSAQEKVEFSKEERVIITQALFRPSPAQPADDGVPVPLLELLRR